MAQGVVKTKPKSTAASGKNVNSGIIKKGSRKFNPKKSSLIKAAKINKKFTAGLTAQTERMLGEKAGHLEMLGQARKKANQPKGHNAAKQTQPQSKSGKKS